MPTDNRKRKKSKEKHLTVDAYWKKSKSAEPDDDKNFLRMAQKNPRVDLRHEKTSHGPQNGSNDGHDSSGISQKFAKDPLNKRKRHKERKRKLKTNLDLQKPKDEVDNGDRCTDKSCLTSKANASDDVKEKRKRKITVDHENIGKVSEECIVKKKKKRKHITPAAEFSESQNSFVAMGPEEKQTLEDNFGVKHLTVDAYSKKSKSADDDKNFLKMARKNPRVDLRHEKTSHGPQTGSNDGHDSSGISQKFAKEPLNKSQRHKKHKRKLKTSLDLQKLQDEVDNGDRCTDKSCLTSKANASDDIKEKRKRKITVDHENIGKVSEECIVKKKKKRKHITPAAEFSESQNSFVAMGPEEKQTLEDNFGVKHLTVHAYSKKSKSADDDNNFLKMARKNPRVDLRHEKTSHGPQTGSNDGHDSSGISQKFAKEPLNKSQRHKKHKRKLKTSLDLQKLQDEVDNGDRCTDKSCLTSKANASDDIKEKRKRKITVDHENIGKVSEKCIVKKKKKRKHLTPAAEFSESQNSFVCPEEKQTLEDSFGIWTSRQKFVDSDVAPKTIQRTSTDTHKTTSGQNKSRSPEKAKKKRKKAKTPESNPSSFSDPSSASSSNDSCETGKTHTFKGDNFEFVGLVTGGVEEKPSSGMNWSLPDSDDEDKEWMKDLPFDLNIGLTVCREGINLKKGRWSGLEDNILRENVKDFCKKHKIQDPRPLVLPVLYSDSREICIFNRATNFHLRICKGLERLPYDAYIRARKIFDEQNYKGKFTEEELATIKQLKKFHGNKWNRIGRQIGRAGQSVFDRYRNTKKGMVKGTWSKEESKQLTQAIKTVTECDNDDILHELVGIPWRKVHLMVPTRTLPQCAHKWKDHLCWSVGNRTKHIWTSADSVELIESIYELEVNEEADIDWLALLQKFWERCPSSTKLMKVWNTLKLKYLSKNYHFMTFEEILDELYQKALPVLRKRAVKLTNIKSAEFVSDSGDDSSDSSEDEWF